MYCTVFYVYVELAGWLLPVCPVKPEMMQPGGTPAPALVPAAPTAAAGADDEAHPSSALGLKSSSRKRVSAGAPSKTFTPTMLQALAVMLEASVSVSMDDIAASYLSAHPGPTKALVCLIASSHSAYAFASQTSSALFVSKLRSTFTHFPVLRVHSLGPKSCYVLR